MRPVLRPKRRRNRSSIAAAVPGRTRPIRCPRRSTESDRTCSINTKLGVLRFASGGSIRTWSSLGVSDRVSGHATMSPIRLRFSRSTETTTAGLRPPCSCPRAGSRSTHHTSPRRGLGPTLLSSALFGPVTRRQRWAGDRVPLFELLPVLSPLLRRHGLQFTVDLVPEPVIGVALDRFGGDIAHGLLRLFRHRLERRVALLREPNKRTRVRGHG